MPLPDVDRFAALLPGDAPPTGHLEVTGPDRVAASAYDVDRLVESTAAYAAAAVDAVAADRGAAVRRRVLDRRHLVGYCTTHCTVDGEPVPAWADLSGVYPTADGRHLQIHANFPHHAAGVCERLGVADDRTAVAAAVARHVGAELEAALVADGMIAALVRTADEWAVHPHARATAGLPLVQVERLGDAPQRPWPAPTGPPPPSGDPAARALAGVRVLDCTRVLAGPVAGRMLADAGADVLRLGAPHLPTVPVGVLTTGAGKRNADVDLTTERGRADVDRLLAGADLWLDAYRPGSFAARGLTPARVAGQRPGIVVVQISAFDQIGPWGARRGYDSIVQSTTGIRAEGGRRAIGGDGTPAGLPVQALDYATGFLAAGVAAQLLAHQRREGGSWLARLSLLRTRDLLVSFAEPRPYTPAAVEVTPELLHTVECHVGALTTVRPFLGEAGAPPTPLGSSTPVWLDR